MERLRRALGCAVEGAAESDARRAAEHSQLLAVLSQCDDHQDRLRRVLELVMARCSAERAALFERSGEELVLRAMVGLAGPQPELLLRASEIAAQGCTFCNMGEEFSFGHNSQLQ